MKKLLISATLCLLVTASFAQKKAVKDAKSALGSKNYTEATTLIKPALTDPETANDPETWKLAGDIGYKQFDEEYQKQILKQATDDNKMYTGLLDSYEPYLKADQLGELPDEKGKVKNKVRKEIATNLRFAYPYFQNGGAINFEKKDYAKAVTYFQIYWDMPNLPMFNNEADKKFFATQDTLIQTIKYYAAISALYSGNSAQAVSLLKRIAQEPFIANPTYKENEVYELIADEYRKANDSVAYVQALQDGAKKFPRSTYFIPNLVNEYIKNGQLDQALLYLDEAIKNDPSNACDFNSVKASIYANRNEFDKSKEFYNAALAADPNCERALEGLAVAYILKAQDLKDQAYKKSDRKEQVALDNQANDLYKKAYPLLERFKALLIARQADKNDIKQAIIKLRNVYYNLNMPEYDKTEEELKKYKTEEEMIKE